MNPLLKVEHLSYAYHSAGGETCALSDLSFQVEKGEFIAIVGPSGCGKSTLLFLISDFFCRKRETFSWMESLCPKAGPPSAICCRRIICWNGAPFTRMPSWAWRSSTVLRKRTC